jgi:mRNA-degrading endonuclease RelE of RelBE toxin-antitoxin system
MKSSRTKDFRKLFVRLPEHIKETAKKNYELWKDNPFYPSLEFKQIRNNENIWSVRVGIGWRALGIIKANEEKIVPAKTLAIDHFPNHCILKNIV